jgi:hypothetical protein
MSYQNARPRPIQNQPSSRKVGIERCLGFLDDKDGEAIALQDVSDGLPAGPVGKSAMHEDDIFHRAETGRREWNADHEKYERKSEP